MTLDEAIKHCQEVAEENRNVDEGELDLLYCGDTECIETHKSNCIACAEEHEQLAEWLKDYKRLLEQPTSDDCVSRQVVFETIDDCNSDRLKGIFYSYDAVERFKEYIKKLPPVTPHGTCKDCENWDKECHYCFMLEQLKNKLDKIKQITNKWISLEEKPNFCMMEIKQVLEREKNL